MLILIKNVVHHSGIGKLYQYWCKSTPLLVLLRRCVLASYGKYRPIVFVMPAHAQRESHVVFSETYGTGPMYAYQVGIGLVP